MRRRNEALVDRLAVARASGMTVRDFAKANKIPVSTLHHWCQSPAFLKDVQRHREALAAAVIARVADKMAARIAGDLLAVPA